MTIGRPSSAAARAARQHAAQRRRAAAAVDRDRPGARRVPAVERHPQQFPLQHDRRVAQHDRQDQRVPGRLMLHRDDAGAGRNIAEAADLAIQADHRLQKGQNRARPEPAEAHHHSPRRQQQRQPEHAERCSQQKEAGVERQRAQAFRPTEASSDLQMPRPSVFPRRRRHRANNRRCRRFRRRAQPDAAARPRETC